MDFAHVGGGGVAGGGVCVAPILMASAPDGPQPVVYLAEVDGIIHPVSAEYLRGAIGQADSAGAALIVITLRTPGGLVDSTRDINTAILAAKTPGRGVCRAVGILVRPPRAF